MPVLTLEELDPTTLEVEYPENELCVLGSDDRWPNKTSRTVREEWFLSDDERAAYRLALLDMLES